MGAASCSEAATAPATTLDNGAEGAETGRRSRRSSLAESLLGVEEPTPAELLARAVQHHDEQTQKQTQLVEAMHNRIVERALAIQAAEEDQRDQQNEVGGSCYAPSFTAGRRETITGGGSSKSRGPPEIQRLGDRILAGVIGCASHTSSRPAEPKPYAVKGVANLEEFVDLEECNVEFRCLSGKGGTAAGALHFNQDDYFCLTLRDGYRLLGVFDGHGCDGHVVSAEVRDMIIRSLLKALPYDRKGKHRASEELVVKALHDAFALVHNHLIERTNEREGDREHGRPVCDARLSGTAACVVVHDLKAKKVHVAWAGNCRMAMAQFEAEEQVAKSQLGEEDFDAPARKPKKKRKIHYVRVTADHDTRNEVEKRRIKIHGRVLRPSPNCNAAGKASRCGPLLDQEHPEEIIVPGEELPAIPLTRTCGSFLAQTLGVNRDPEVKTVDVFDCKFYVLASDGVWEVLTEKHVLHAINEVDRSNTSYAIGKLMKQAQDAWGKRGHYVDDMTIIVVWI
eukprot:TRINITY_DN63679_c0_g1_i1.p1 TRINITY_DN63679_c0_g1~~TRINITY_DN63679_c0_g1_i1.p1  ORF type:complete len:540 (-),score=125.88 TRINITY_DN63679_c0_g1_i1:483-2012(-)